MSSTTSSSLRRRAGLAVGTGALLLLGGAGFAYAATSGDPVETGWATVVAGDACPEQGAGGSSGSAAPDPTPESATSSQDGDL